MFAWIISLLFFIAIIMGNNVHNSNDETQQLMCGAIGIVAVIGMIILAIN